VLCWTVKFQEFEVAVMDEDPKTTEWALLFPLKAGLFAFKSSTVITHSAPDTSEPSSEDTKTRQRECLDDGKLEDSFPTISSTANSRLKMRRRSSMSDIDKFTSSVGLPPDLVRYTGGSSTPTSYHLRVSGDGYDSVPHSPGTSRRSNTPDIGACGSIGDLMNMKRFGGSSWSVRSCTETIIAKTVPLSTVTPRGSSPPSPLQDYKQQPELPRIDSRDGERSSSFEDVEYDGEDSGSPPKLTCSQRTERLSRLIRQQRGSIFVNTSKTVCFIRMTEGLRYLSHWHCFLLQV
jgi:hypothetical protein